MACTTSIGPGATNMITAAGLAHVDRLPVLFLPGDIFASRLPDPVLQQIEAFGDPTVSVNDCFRPVSRFWDRIMRPEQLLQSLPQAMRVLTDPADCGPVTLCMPQDVQTQAYDFPAEFFETRQHRLRRPAPDANELADAAAAIRAAKKPMVIVGGGVHYSEALPELKSFLGKHGLLASETQAGKGALNWDEAANLGSVGVTGGSAANALAADADLVLAIGTRLQDFTTGSWNLFKARPKLVQLNVAGYDAWKHGALPLIGDAKVTLPLLSQALGGWKAPAEQAARSTAEIARWRGSVDAATAAPKQGNALPSDAQVLGAVNRKSAPTDIMVCAAGGLPGELHKLWKTRDPKGYHLEYGYSCMGYEIAGGLGVKLAYPDRRVIVLVGDGSYMMMNSEIATSVMMGAKLDIVVLDNRGFGCINRLQQACGGRPFNNLLDDAYHKTESNIDFAAHAASMGAVAEKVGGINALEAALDRAKTSDRTHVIVIDTDPMITTKEGGAWWEVAVPEVSTRKEVEAARKGYEQQVAARARE
jgi:3D-(3,5/4)-trihydroxycyclohexane-1,2-dione acylhydrolase (decyclizing)